MDTIENEPAIFDKALDQMYSAWNYVKNIRYVKEAMNWELIWIGPRVCKRESRRFIGDYVVTSRDVEAGTFFDDAIAYGGFAEDIHYPREEQPEYIKITYLGIPPVYTIPYRSIYSKDINNLFFASRLVSVSHIAHGSVRVQRTLSAIGQAAGTAAWLCKRYGCSPRAIYRDHIHELQQLLLKEDAAIPGVRNTDPLDLARTASVTADEERCFIPDQPDRWLAMTSRRGVMLWDWPKKLTRTSFLFRNSGGEITIKAVLRLRQWEQRWKNHQKPAGFPYENCINEVEWGDNNSVDLFKEIAVSHAVMPNGEHWAAFTWDTELIEKIDTIDEDRYIIEIDIHPQLSMAVDNRFFAAARLIEHKGTEYEALPQCPVMVIEPRPVYGEARNLTDGISRRFSYNPIHMWQTWTPAPHQVTLQWEKPQKITMVQITFDTITRTYHEMPFDCGKQVHEKCVKDYRILAMKDDEWVTLTAVKDNFRRFRRHEVGPIVTGRLMLAIDAAWGADQPVGVYEIRVY